MTARDAWMAECLLEILETTLDVQLDPNERTGMANAEALKRAVSRSPSEAAIVLGRLASRAMVLYRHLDDEARGATDEALRADVASTFLTHDRASPMLWAARTVHRL